MGKMIQAQDVARAPFSNAFTLQDNAGAVVLNDPERVYAITEVRASGAWTASYSNSDRDGEVYTRNGSGNSQFTPIPWVAEDVSFSGVDEVSGYWIPAGRTR